MTTILRLDASARQARSLTRMMSGLFLEHWLAQDPEAVVLSRDVGSTPPPPISEEWIEAVFAVPETRTADQLSLLELSDTLIGELERADIILMAAPMYNYGMPAALKAWVDQVVRIGKTFTFDLDRGDRPLEPILSGKTLVLLTASGEFGFGPGEVNGDASHLVPHIRTVSKYFGVDQLHHICIEYQEFKDARFERSKAKAVEEIGALVAALRQAS